MELAYDEPPPCWGAADLAQTDPYFTGKWIGKADLPFCKFYADAWRAVAFVFQLTGRFGQNRDHGTELRLAEIPSWADDQDTRFKFQQATDRHPVRVFHAQGRILHYRGVYLLTSIDKPVGVWRFRRLNEKWHNRYVGLTDWFTRVRAQAVRVGRPVSRRELELEPADEGEASCSHILADY
jgi:hypothetical protein